MARRKKDPEDIKTKKEKEEKMLESVQPLKKLYEATYSATKNEVIEEKEVLEKLSGLWKLIEKLDKVYKEVRSGKVKVLSKENETLRKVVEEIMLGEVKKTFSDASYAFYNDKLSVGSFMILDVRPMEIGTAFIDQDANITIVQNMVNMSKRMN